MKIDAFEGEYRFLSNFYPSPVLWQEVLYPTVEHAYQAAKTLNLEDREWIRTALTPAMAKKRGSAKGVGGRKIELREDWEPFGKVLVMKRLVWRKFSENTALAQQLIDTGDAELIEGNWWGDTFWGVCQGYGENMLGQILMQVRAELVKGEEDGGR